MKIYFDSSKLKHGELVPGGGGRWCKQHRMVHGRLYACETYPLELIQRIKEADSTERSLGMSFALLVILIVLMCTR